MRPAPFCRKADVETELPARTDHVRFVALTPSQRDNYSAHEMAVAQLVHLARRRPLLPAEQDMLMREMAMMRMICDTNSILGDEDRACPKLAELESILSECRENAQVKVIVFSEWEKMLELVRGSCGKLGLGFAWHTGAVPQQRRRVEINRFKSDPDCRVFLSTDSGGVGLNLQSASVVVNCDLPWNPARLEQRIARAWRKHQTRAVTVFNLEAVGRDAAAASPDTLALLQEVQLRRHAHRAAGGWGGSRELQTLPRDDPVTEEVMHWLLVSDRLRHLLVNEGGGAFEPWLVPLVWSARRSPGRADDVRLELTHADGRTAPGELALVRGQAKRLRGTARQPARALA